MMATCFHQMFHEQIYVLTYCNTKLRGMMYQNVLIACEIAEDSEGLMPTTHVRRRLVGTVTYFPNVTEQFTLLFLDVCIRMQTYTVFT